MHLRLTHSKDWSRGLKLATCLAALLLVLCVRSSQAQIGSQTIVTRGSKNTDPLRVDATLVGSQTNSFYKVQVDITNVKRPTPGDRNLVIVLYVKGWGEAVTGGVAYSKLVTLQENATTASIEIPVAQDFQQAAWCVGVFEGGNDIENKKMRPKNQQPWQYSYYQQPLLCCSLIQGKNQPDLDVKRELASLNSILAQYFQITVQGAGNQRIATSILQVDDLPTEWWHYLSQSFWIITTETLQELQQTAPQSLEHLRHYVAAGGYLMVVGRSQFDDEEIIGALLNKATETIVWQPIVEPRPDWWTLSSQPRIKKTATQNNATSKTITTTNVTLQNALGQAIQQAPVAVQSTEPEASEPANEEITPAGVLQDSYTALQTVLRPGLGQHFQNSFEIASELDLFYTFGNNNPGTVLRWLQEKRALVADSVETKKANETQFGQGRILLLENSFADVPPEIVKEEIGQMLQESLPNTVCSDGNWFWSNLNRAVGKPPVWTFMVLVGLFGLVLGPGLLFMTGRVGRRSLMLFLVPLVSLLATCTIVVYGVLHEGFDSHVRITSVTTYDADSQSGMAWSRQNYFSGLPPREGLVFSPDTYIRAVPAASSQWYTGGNPRNTVTYSVVMNGEQHAWENWLSPRTQQQLLIGHPVRDPFELPVEIEWAVAPDGANTNFSVIGSQIPEVTITNRSDEELPFVIARGDNNDFYLVEDLGLGESKQAEAISLKDAEFRFSARLNKYDLLPSPPPEMEGGGQLIDLGGNFNSSKNDIANDVLNPAMRDPSRMPAFSFLTVLRTNPAIYVPLEGQHSEDLHFVVGTKRW